MNGTPPASSPPGRPLPADDRPFDHTPVDTDDLPDTPTRDRNIAASAWRQAPMRLGELGDDLGHSESAFKRRLHGWLLWRAGPAKGPARYLAIDATDLERHVEFELFGDKTGRGTGPSGQTHDRFRTWKEDLRDHPTGAQECS